MFCQAYRKHIHGEMALNACRAVVYIEKCGLRLIGRRHRSVKECLVVARSRRALASRHVTHRVDDPEIRRARVQEHVIEHLWRCTKGDRPKEVVIIVVKNGLRSQGALLGIAQIVPRRQILQPSLVEKTSSKRTSRANVHLDNFAGDKRPEHYQQYSCPHLPETLNCSEQARVFAETN